MTAYTLDRNLAAKTARNDGINKEWVFGANNGIIRTTHDHIAYDKDSDFTINGIGYSVKSSAFTLMSGCLCEGLKEFDEIIDLYRSKVHSTRFAYVTDEYVAYVMNMDEFEEFLRAFARTERESSKNGGATKIRCRKESAKMREWLAEKSAA